MTRKSLEQRRRVETKEACKSICLPEIDQRNLFQAFYVKAIPKMT